MYVLVSQNDVIQQRSSPSRCVERVQRRPFSPVPRKLLYLDLTVEVPTTANSAHYINASAILTAASAYQEDIIPSVVSQRGSDRWLLK
jgi:hypothetical protein